MSSSTDPLQRPTGHSDSLLRAAVIHDVNGACQTTAYAEEGGCLASLFPYVWRTRRFKGPLGRGIGRRDANFDLQRQFCS